MKAYIFDLDGTLLDSMHVWQQIDVDFLARRHIAVPPDYTDIITPMGSTECATYTIARFNLPEQPEDLLREWHAMAIDAYSHSVPLKPYALDYLRALRKKGAKVAIATSLSPELHQPALERHGLSALFDAIAHSDEVGCGKSKPDVFLLAAERLGVAPEDCVVFDDILPAIAAAKSAGMMAYAVYDESSAADWAAMQRIADGTLRDFREAPLL